ncbi:MAG TPA: gephyrin-like molybdotransferase Glp [Thermoanaerobaculia bacterium]|jgi:molybdopterin molybdotransferase|nr:gephyrin-like molybdotransferase Glp [Thermoanaerobaculia bacterium]
MILPVAESFQKPRAGDRMLSVEEAQEQVLAEVGLLDAEEVPLADAQGLVLREDVAAPFDVPEGDNSAMDGYAVRAADVPGPLRVIEDVPAGRIATLRVEAGTAIRIMTGALLPLGADAVAQVEITDGGSSVVQVSQPLTAGTNVRRCGEDMVAGSLVLRAGSPIGAAEIGVLAGVQKTRVLVSRRPTVAILSTGDELVAIDQPRGRGKVVNSNAYALAALVRENGGEPRVLGIVPDEREATIAAIEAALDCDFVLSSGGVSVGAFDFVKDALDALGAETKFWRIAMKPGKPVVLSRLRGRLYFGLPGNPVSSMVAFLLFVAPSLRKAMGRTSGLLPPIVLARLQEPLSARGDRRTYLRVRVSAVDGELVAIVMRAQGSGVSTSMLGANGLAILEQGVTAAAAGERVRTVLFGGVA